MGEHAYAAQWQTLRARVADQRMPHALLLTGAMNSGKTRFAQAFAWSLLCQSPRVDGRACGECSACHLLAVGSHGDCLYVLPQEGSRAIKTQQIRDICQQLSLTSQYNGHRIGIISPADAMNTAAANSLLKTLEEPCPGVTIILVTAKLSALPITIRSRCQRLRLQSQPKSRPTNAVTDNAVVEQWESALRPHGDYFNLAAEWAKTPHEPIFTALFQWVQTQTKRCFNSSQPCDRALFAKREQLFKLYDELLACYRFAASPGINLRSLYERLLLRARAYQNRYGFAFAS